MGLFDRMKKSNHTNPKSSENTSSDAEEAKELLQNARIHANWINETDDPDTFKMHYQSLIQNMTRLSKYEGIIAFNGSTPTDEIQYLSENYINFTYGLIERISALPDEDEIFEKLRRILDLDFPDLTKSKARNALWSMKSERAKREAARFCSTMRKPHFYREEHNAYFEGSIEEAFLLSTDYLQSCNVHGCCAGCAMYRDRIYSITGQDTRLPRIPEYTCTCRGMSFLPFLHEPSQDDILHSNRPFLDDRTDEDKQEYQYVLDYRFYQKQAEKDKQIYEQLCELLPDDAPKSFSAFRRMKNADTEHFQELAAKAAAYDLDICMSKGEHIALERYKAYCKDHGYKL